MKYRCMGMGYSLCIMLFCSGMRVPGKEISRSDTIQLTKNPSWHDLKESEVVAFQDEDGLWYYARLLKKLEHMQRCAISLVYGSTESDMHIPKQRIGALPNDKKGK